MINLKETTFIIPIMIDTNDRRENIDIVVGYISHHFDTNIIIKESDYTQKYETLKVKYIYEKNEGDFFHRTRLLNDMIMVADTKYIFNYDADVLLPVESYIKTIEMLEKGYDVVWPYIEDDLETKSQVLVDRKTESFRGFKKSYNINVLKDNKKWQAKYGFCFCMRKSTYISSFLENENFKSYGPEDWERPVRYRKLGLKIGRVEDKIYHIEHRRTKESNRENFYFNYNNKLWEDIQKMNRKQLIEYYQNQDYFIRRKKHSF